MKFKTIVSVSVGALLIFGNKDKVNATTQVDISFNSGSVNVYNSNGSTLLSGGSTADGNGAVLELGYYSSGTTLNPFAGTFVALTGAESSNTATVPGSSELMNQTSIGDNNINGAGDGTFAIGVSFVVGSNSGFNLPSAGVPLVIKFFNNTTVAGSTFYNVVANTSNWLWATPGTSPNEPVINMSLDDAGLSWYSVAVAGQAGTTAFDTTVALIPEPTSMALLGAGMLMMGSMVRRRK